MKKFFKKYWFFLLTSLLVLALFSLRFLHLNILPVFADEAIYIRWSQIMRAEQTLRFLPLSDGKQPLYMWLIIPFFKVITNPLNAGRLVSVFSGFGTLIGICLLTQLLFKDKRATLAAGLIYAVSPFTFFFDRLALADSLLSMFGLWTFIFSYLAVKKQRLDYAMLSGFALGGAWLTKSPAVFFALMLPSLWLFAPWKKGGSNKKILIKSIFFTLVSIIIGYGFYNILRLGPNFNLIASRNMDYVYPPTHILTRPFDPLKVFVIASFRWIWIMGPGAILALWLTSCFLNWKQYRKELVVLTVWFLLPILIQSEYAKSFTARYILFSVPFLIVIAASSFARIQNVKKHLHKLVVFLLALFVAQSLVFDYWLINKPENANLPRSERSGYLEEWTAGQGINETANYLINRSISNPEQKIVIGTEGFFGTLPDGLQMYLATHPEILAIGVGLNFESLPSQLIDSQRFGNDTYLLVNASRFHNTAEKLGLKLINEYPKAVKPDGTQDSLLFFQVTNEALEVK